MAGVNLSSFNEIKNKYNNLSGRYNSLESTYIDGLDSLDTEDLFQGMDLFNDLFIELKDLSTRIDQELKAVTVKENTYEKYMSYKDDIDSLISSTIGNYNKLKNLKYSFAYVSDLEDDTIKKFEIDIY